MGEPHIIENIAIYVCTAAIVLGLWAMGAGGHSFWGLSLLMFVNYRAR